MGTLGDLIAAAHPGIVEQELFGTTDPAAIASVLASLVTEATGQGAAAGLWYRSSVAAVAGVHLDGGGAVAVHAYPGTVTPGFLDGVVRVQHHLADAGFPCPRPVSGPVRAGAILGLVESLWPDPGMRAFAPREMAASADGLERFVSLAAAVDPAGLDAHPMAVPATALYPRPHSPVFDFEATAEGAEWIDAIATAARDQMAVGQLVIAHGDWSARNVRLGPAGLTCVYDWESVQVLPEPTAVGIAAATWRAIGAADEPLAPTANEIQEYVERYAAACGRPFGAVARRAAHAAAVYCLAYTARCEHALTPGTTTGRATGRLTDDGLGSLLRDVGG